VTPEAAGPSSTRTSWPSGSGPRASRCRPRRCKATPGPAVSCALRSWATRRQDQARASPGPVPRRARGRPGGGRGELVHPARLPASALAV